MDLGAIGSTRLYRELELGRTQREIASEGGFQQADISNFENARRPLTRRMARRFARVLFAALWSRDPIAAEKRVWDQWLVNVREYGPARVKRWAEINVPRINEQLGWALPLQMSARGAGDVVALPEASGVSLHDGARQGRGA